MLLRASRLVPVAALLLLVPVAAVSANAAKPESDRPTSDRSPASLAQAAGCRPITSGAASPELLVAVDLPLQGPSRYQTVQMADAVEFMLTRAKWRAGGYSLGLKVCDNATAAQRAWDERRCQANGRAHVADSQVVAIVGTYNSGCTALQLPITNRAGLVTVSPANTYPCLTEQVPGCPSSEPFRYQPTGKRTYARVVGHDGLQAEAMVNLARKRGAKRMFFLHEDGLYGRGGALLARAVAAERGIRIAGLRKWPVGGGLASLMAEIRRSGADAILVFGVYTNGGSALLRQKLAELGSNRQLPVYVSDGFVTSSLLDEVGVGSDGLVGFAPSFPPLALGSRARTLVRAFARWNRIPAGEVWDYPTLTLQAAELVLEAIRASDGTREGVRNAVFRLRSRGSILGPFRISPEGDARPARIGVFTARGGGWRLTSIVRVP